jgi:LuxR family maltose regulon positive regulatory protein
VARSVGMLSHPSTADAYLAVTLVALERGEPRRAALSLHEGSLRAEANHRSNLTWVAHLELAMLRAADGEPQPSATTTGPNQLGAPPPLVVAQRLRALEARMLRLGGAYREAARVAAGGHSDAEVLRFEQVAAALAMGQTDKARKIIDVAPADTHTGNPAAAVRSLIQSAWLSDIEGLVAKSEQYLADALRLGEQYWLVELFVQAGPAVIQLVAARHEARSSFQEAVLLRSREARPQPTGNGLIDPLTDRELEILSYLPSRATNSEMAERCFVSVNTIKTHMAHIYRKLDVANRSGAIRRAQDIGLL